MVSCSDTEKGAPNPILTMTLVTIPSVTALMTTKACNFKNSYALLLHPMKIRKQNHKHPYNHHSKICLDYTLIFYLLCLQKFSVSNFIFQKSLYRLSVQSIVDSYQTQRQFYHIRDPVTRL